MLHYALRCELARQRGAIGEFHPIVAIIVATDQGGAERLYRDVYETAGPPIVLVESWSECGDRPRRIDARRDATGRLFQVNDVVVSDTRYPGREGRIVRFLPGLPLVDVVSSLPLGEIRDTWPESDLQLVRARTADDVPCY